MASSAHRFLSTRSPTMVGFVSFSTKTHRHWNINPDFLHALVRTKILNKSLQEKEPSWSYLASLNKLFRRNEFHRRFGTLSRPAMQAVEAMSNAFCSRPDSNLVYAVPGLIKSEFAASSNLSSLNNLFGRNEFYRRFGTLSGLEMQGVEDVVAAIEACSSKRDSDSVNGVPDETGNECSVPSNVKYYGASSLKVSARHDLAMIFTCKVCETRSIKTVCRESYEKGVVVCRCSGCKNLHLIADRLGWFGEPETIEDLLAARGEEVKRGSVDTLNLTLEDLAGKKLNP